MSYEKPNSENFQLSLTTADSGVSRPKSEAFITQPAPAESPAPNRLKSAVKKPSGIAAEDPIRVTFSTPLEIKDKVDSAKRWLKAEMLVQGAPSIPRSDDEKTVAAHMMRIAQSQPRGLLDTR